MPLQGVKGERFPFLPGEAVREKIKNQHGFTLIEMIIYIAIIGLVVSGFLFFSVSIGSSGAKTRVASEVQENVRTALELMGKKIRAAESVIQPAKGASGSLLELNMPPGVPDVVVQVVNGVLLLDDTVDQIAVTTDEVRVEDLQFVNIGKSGERDSIRIFITIAFNNTGNDVLHTFSQSVETAVGIRR